MNSIIVIIAIVVVIYFIFKKGTTSKKKSASTKKVVLKTKLIQDDDEEAYSMYFDVVGESFKNEDGTDRQEIIKKHVKELNPAHLKFYNYKGSLACAVYVDEAMGKQVGNIPKHEVQELYELATDESTYISPRFYEKKGGGDYMYGVTIEILIKEED